MALISPHPTRERIARAAAAIAAGAALLLLTACSGVAPTGTPTGQTGDGGPASDAIKVSRLVFEAGTPGRTELDLRFLAEPYVWPWRPVYDNLIAVDAKSGKLVPGLATAWKIEPDGESFRVTLRDAKFNGGYGPVRGEDVKFGWEQLVLVDSVHGQQPYFKNNVKSVEAPSEKEVIFHMKGPDGIFVTAISDYQGGLEVRSKASYEKQGAPNWKNGPLAGSGPYAYKEGADGQFLRLARADNNHWSGTPDFAELEWRFAKEASTRMAALLTGEAHMADLPQDLMAQAEKQNMKVIRGEFPGTRVWGSFRCCFVKEPLNLTSSGMMFPESPLADRRVRQALNKAINRDEMNKAFFAGKGETMYLDHFHSTRLGWNADWEKRFKDLYGYDPAAAKKLLADAGQANLKTTMLVTPLPGVPGGEDLAEALAGYWRAIGVNIALETVDVAQANTIARSFGYSNQLKLEASGSNQWSGQTIWNSSVSHLGLGVENPKVDALLRQIAATPDTAKQEELWKQAGAEAYEDFMDVNLFWLPTEIVVNPKVVASWTYPGGITGAWTHAVNIKAAAK